jgi:hypothetical protein
MRPPAVAAVDDEAINRIRAHDPDIHCHGLGKSEAGTIHICEPGSSPVTIDTAVHST